MPANPDVKKAWDESSAYRVLTKRKKKRCTDMPIFFFTGTLYFCVHLFLENMWGVRPCTCVSFLHLCVMVLFVHGAWRCWNDVTGASVVTSDDSGSSSQPPLCCEEQLSCTYETSNKRHISSCSLCFFSVPVKILLAGFFKSLFANVIFFPPIFRESWKFPHLYLCKHGNGWLIVYLNTWGERGLGKEKDLINESAGRPGPPRVAGKFWMEGSDTLE